MQLNANLSQRVVVESSHLPWTGSPAAGIERRLLERDGAEVARATSVVRYAPGARFARHTHELGEEIFVLDGVLDDETGSFGPGTYIKNPPGSSHAPGSASGCTLFVKLRHLDLSDHVRTVIDTRTARWLPGQVPGLSVLPLSQFDSPFGPQNTALVRWAPGTHLGAHRHHGGEEIYVLDGVFEDDAGRYPAGTWIRNPHASMHRPFSEQGCTILVKTGHLPLTQSPEPFG